MPIVKLLIQNSANVNAARPDGITPLYVAAQEGKTEILLLQIFN